MDERIGRPWRYEVWLRHAPGRRLVKAGNTAKRYEAMQLVAEMLRHVEPVDADADATVALDGRDEPRPLRLYRSGGTLLDWTAPEP